MTAYNLSYLFSATSTTYTYSLGVSLRAGEYPIRIIQVEIDGTDTGTGTRSYWAFKRYENSTISGGVSLTATSARQDSPAVSATARHQTWTYTSSSGTFSTGSAVSTSGTALSLKQQTNDDGAIGIWQPPTEVLVSPGSVFNISPIVVTSGTTVYMSYFSIWFDEERVSRST